MRTISTTVYDYSELSDEAKEKARDWYRTRWAHDSDWGESVLSDFTEAIRALGFDPASGNPNIRPRPSGIYYSGFSSQGDGACFEGSWSAVDCKPAKVKALIEDRPKDLELVRIAVELSMLATAYPNACASLTHRGRYYHEMTVDVDFDPNDGNGEPDNEHTEEFTELARGLMRYLYRRLESEYEYLNSDEVVAESLEVNGYEFTADGAPQ
jgi:hypothetical protein